MSEFTPELGQWGLSNTPWQEIESPDWIEPGLEAIAEAIVGLSYDGEVEEDYIATLTANSGNDPFANAVFIMRSYCWCDGEREGHEEGCPPNFEHVSSGLIINWYKHVGRSRSQNKAVTRKEWSAILTSCLSSLA